MPLPYPNHSVRILNYWSIHIEPVFGYLPVRLVVHPVIGWEQLLGDRSHWTHSPALPACLAPGSAIFPSLATSSGPSSLLTVTGFSVSSQGARVRHQQCLLLSFMFSIKLKTWIWDFSTPLVIKCCPAGVVWKAERLCSWARGCG